MNIFVLDENPKLAAIQQLDKHVVKMPLESGQLLCSAFEKNQAPYKRTHYNHPCSIWTRQSKENFLWLVEHGLSLCEEYTFRYSKIHKTQKVIDWCRDNILKIQFPQTGLTPFAQAMPWEYKNESAVLAYQAYYIGEKAKIAKWTKREIPNWWTENEK